MPTEKHAEYMAFPRSCALAEVAWSPKKLRDWADFRSRVAVHLERLDNLGVNFYRRSEFKAGKVDEILIER